MFQWHTGEMGVAISNGCICPFMHCTLTKSSHMKVTMSSWFGRNVWVRMRPWFAAVLLHAPCLREIQTFEQVATGIVMLLSQHERACAWNRKADEDSEAVLSCCVHSELSPTHFQCGFPCICRTGSGLAPRRC